MKEWELAEDFRAICDLDPLFTGQCRHEQDDGDYERPCFVFAVKTRALDGSGSAFAFRLAITVHTDARETDEDEPTVVIAGTAHAARVSAMQAKFFASGAKAAMTAALAALGHFTLLGYDAGGEEGDAALSGTRFETPVHVAGVVRVL